MFFAVSALCLVLSFLLAVTFPRQLVRAKWPFANPTLALVTWLALSVGSGLSLIACFFALGIAFNKFALELIFGGIGALLVLRLIYLMSKEAYLTYIERNKHKQLLFLLVNGIPNSGKIIDHESPNSYCLPGPPTSVTTLAEGLMNTLTSEEIAAICLHEDAHLGAKHHWIIMTFQAWEKTLPLPFTKAARDSVSTLIEILADKHATQLYTPRVVSQSLVNAAGTSMNPTLSNNYQYTQTRATKSRLIALLTKTKDLSPREKLLVKMGDFIAIVLPMSVFALILFNI
ncbi:MAG: M56 family metallopeptidase [Micrococcaceae bacterium]